VKRPILIRGGRVLAMTPGSGETAADLLIRGERIEQIAAQIDCPDAEVIDAAGMIVLPGFVDTHRHVWQTQLRTVATDWPALSERLQASTHRIVEGIRSIPLTQIQQATSQMMPRLD